MVSSLPPLTHHITTKLPDGTTAFHHADLERHEKALQSKPYPSFPAAGGSACHVLDFDPNPDNSPGFVHRTNTIEYCFVLEGELELALQSGEKRIIKQGEIVVQRVCMHSWKNTSETKCARLAAVSIGSKEATEGEVETPQGKQSM
ncbi:uncharacterized protein LY89DRAFT_600133 [Mollisia scopiformis]|uniref:Cupin type-2 domain-containing protein n=1 Tax=Mollisia scopiformis TaxID=149040 RepID=A0A132B768_MOLSC|nr:uncharacterized protein LY89DRAFT_600133 [Mollisia scopiformis]KUJ08255.1 hypothetical protein LY89DRAFT_600133 [Mollisia scopiformis]